MIFYTPVPVESVFEGYDQMKLNYQEVQIGHLTMVVEQISEAESRVIRLISPNPQDYLNPQYQPGTMIKLKPMIS